MVLYESMAMVSQLRRHVTFFFIKECFLKKWYFAITLPNSNNWSEPGRTRKSCVPVKVHIKHSRLEFPQTRLCLSFWHQPSRYVNTLGCLF